MNHHDEEALQAWLDGAGTSAEREAFRQKINTDPELAAAVALEERVASSLRAQFEPRKSALIWPKAPAVPSSRFPNEKWKVAAAVVVLGLLVAIGFGAGLFQGHQDESVSKTTEAALWSEDKTDAIRAVPVLQTVSQVDSAWGQHLTTQWQTCCIAPGVTACTPIRPLPQELRSLANSKVDLSPGCNFDLDSVETPALPGRLPVVSMDSTPPKILRCSAGNDNRLLVVSAAAQDPKPQVAKEAGFSVWRRALSGYVFYECGEGPEAKMLPFLKTPAP